MLVRLQLCHFLVLVESRPTTEAASDLSRGNGFWSCFLAAHYTDLALLNVPACSFSSVKSICCTWNAICRLGIYSGPEIPLCWKLGSQVAPGSRNRSLRPNLSLPRLRASPRCRRGRRITGPDRPDISPPHRIKGGPSLISEVCTAVSKSSELGGSCLLRTAGRSARCTGTRSRWA